MEIKFSNATVPVWKLRFGTVVALANRHDSYAHIVGFCTKVKEEIYLAVLIGEERKALKPKELYWLEPN